MAIIRIQKELKTGKDVGEREPLHPVGRNVNYCSLYWNQYAGSFIKLKLELTYDLLYQHKIDMCANQAYCDSSHNRQVTGSAQVPIMDEQIKNMW
jgi:hypothetical protein